MSDYDLLHSMLYTCLGNTGLKVSRLCLGCMSFGNQMNWMVEEDEAKQVIKRAWDLGINFFDTANSYSKGRSEEILGNFLAEINREEAVVATKVYNPMGNGVNQRGLSRKHLLWQIKQSLNRLKTDYIDVYQIHRWDYDTPIDETLCTMTNLLMENKIHYIGASSMWAWQFAKSLYTSDIKGYKRFVSMQNLYNLLYREEEREMIPLCKSEKIALIPWSPTARGFLSGRFFKNGKLLAAENNKSQQAVGSNAFNLYIGRQENDQIVRRVLELASNKQVKPAQIAIAWLFTKEVTAPIVGTSKVDHLEEFVESLDVKITADESRYLEEPYVPQPVFGHN